MHSTPQNKDLPQGACQAPDRASGAGDYLPGPAADRDMLVAFAMPVDLRNRAKAKEVRGYRCMPEFRRRCILALGQ